MPGPSQSNRRRPTTYYKFQTKQIQYAKDKRKEFKERGEFYRSELSWNRKIEISSHLKISENKQKQITFVEESQREKALKSSTIFASERRCVLSSLSLTFFLAKTRTNSGLWISLTCEISTIKFDCNSSRLLSNLRNLFPFHCP